MDALFPQAPPPRPTIQLQVRFQGENIPGLEVIAIALEDGRFQFTGGYILNNMGFGVHGGRDALIADVISRELERMYNVGNDVLFKYDGVRENRMVITAVHRNNENEIILLHRKNNGGRRRRKTRRRKTYRQNRR